jgi:hypothetical protein
MARHTRGLTCRPNTFGRMNDYIRRSPRWGTSGSLYQFLPIVTGRFTTHRIRGRAIWLRSPEYTNCRRSAEHVAHCHCRAAYQVLKPFILNRDRGFDLVECGRDGRHAGRQRAVYVKFLIELPFMNHQTRPACEISILDREETHEGRACGIDRSLAQEDKSAVRNPGVRSVQVVWPNNAPEARVTITRVIMEPGVTNTGNEQFI